MGRTHLARLHRVKLINYVTLAEGQMKRQTILSALIACFAVAACVVVPPVGNETRPMTAVDTSWQVGKGFDLDEAKTLIELCTSLDYSVGSPSYDAPGVAQPQNVVGWEEIFPTPESILPSNGPPTPIGFYKTHGGFIERKPLIIIIHLSTSSVFVVLLMMTGVSYRMRLHQRLQPRSGSRHALIACCHSSLLKRRGRRCISAGLTGWPN